MKKRFVSIVIIFLLVLSCSIPAFADDGRVTVTQNEGGKVELHSDAEEIAPGVFTVKGNAQILFYITADEGYTLSHVYFNEQDLGYIGTGTKHVWLSPNGASTALRVEFTLLDSSSSESAAPSSETETLSSSSEETQSSSSSSSTSSVSNPSVEDGSNNAASNSVPLPSNPGVTGIENQDMLNDGVGFVENEQGIQMNWTKIGIIIAIFTAIAIAVIIIVMILRRV